MWPLRSTLSILSITPVLRVHCSTCVNAPLLVHQSLRSQCFVSIWPPPHSPKRFSTSGPDRSSPTSSVAYRIAASFSAKGRKFKIKEDLYIFDEEQHPQKKPYTGRPASGQDAFFVAKTHGLDWEGVAFGVADGVGGWSDSGIDSADFSHGLCESMALLAGEGTDAGKNHKDASPRTLLDRAYNSVVEKGEITGGGSTACVAVGAENGNLVIANLGDSGFVQLRPGAIHNSSYPQTHAFNTPFQLSIVPPRIIALSRAFGGGPLNDQPEAADSSAHWVRHGDVLVFATDGVWDNLSAEDLLRLVNRFMESSTAWTRGEEEELVPSDELEALTNRSDEPLQAKLAATIAGEAKTASLDKKRDGPFAKEVQKSYPGDDYHGGKVDDICVVVAVIVGREGTG